MSGEGINVLGMSRGITGAQEVLEGFKTFLG